MAFASKIDWIVIWNRLEALSPLQDRAPTLDISGDAHDTGIESEFPRDSLFPAKGYSLSSSPSLPPIQLASTTSTPLPVSWPYVKPALPMHLPSSKLFSETSRNRPSEKYLFLQTCRLTIHTRRVADCRWGRRLLECKSSSRDNPNYEWLFYIMLLSPSSPISRPHLSHMLSGHDKLHMFTTNTQCTGFSLTKTKTWTQPRIYNVKMTSTRMVSLSCTLIYHYLHVS